MNERTNGNERKDEKFGWMNSTRLSTYFQRKRGNGEKIIRNVRNSFTPEERYVVRERKKERKKFLNDSRSEETRTAYPKFPRDGEAKIN